MTTPFKSKHVPCIIVNTQPIASGAPPRWGQAWPYLNQDDILPRAQELLKEEQTFLLEIQQGLEKHVMENVQYYKDSPTRHEYESMYATQTFEEILNHKLKDCDILHRIAFYEKLIATFE